MTNEIELLLKPLAEDWWKRFSAKFAKYPFGSQVIDTGTATQFCSLHFGLRRQQVKLLAQYWQQKGRIQLVRKGWKIRLAQLSQMAEVH